MSSPILALLFLLSLVVSVQSAHLSGWTWSAVPQLIPNSATRYAPNCGPQAAIFYYQYVVAFKPIETDQVTYLNFFWGGDAPNQRIWQRLEVPGAHSPVEAAVFDCPIQQNMMAIWVSNNGSLASAVLNQDYYEGERWDQYHESQSYAPTNLPLTPWPDTLDATIELYHMVPGTTTMANITSDGYSLFDDYTSNIHNAWTTGGTTKNNVDLAMWMYYMGANADGTGPDGFIWSTHIDTDTYNFYTEPVNTGFPVDADSMVSAVQWQNSTATYNMFFWKYQGEIVYSMYRTFYAGHGEQSPYMFHTGINCTMGPSVVSGWDAFYDDFILNLWFSNIDPNTGEYAVYTAIGMQDWNPQW